VAEIIGESDSTVGRAFFSTVRPSGDTRCVLRTRLTTGWEKFRMTARLWPRTSDAGTYVQRNGVLRSTLGPWRGAAAPVSRRRERAGQAAGSSAELRQPIN